MAALFISHHSVGFLIDMSSPNAADFGRIQGVAGDGLGAGTSGRDWDCGQMEGRQLNVPSPATGRVHICRDLLSHCESWALHD
jgi:hypothetical protein